jgi:hypothetical protein
VIAVTAQDRAALRDWDATIDRLFRQGELARRKVHPDTLVAGRAHERYDQYIEGIRIVGGDLSRQIAKGVTESIFGRLHSRSRKKKRVECSSGSRITNCRRVDLSS